jgi:hypothetical protein
MSQRKQDRSGRCQSNASDVKLNFTLARGDQSHTFAQERQFQHLLAGSKGMCSRCLRCGLTVATAGDEWLLLEAERVHECPS